MSWDSFSLLSELGSRKPQDLGKQKMLPPHGQHRLGSTGWAAALLMKDLGFLVDSGLKVSQQCTLVAIKANHMLGYIRECS